MNVFQCCSARIVVGQRKSVCFPFTAAANAARTATSGLAEADVAADEAVHRPRHLEVLLDRLDRSRLVLGLAVRELGLEPFEPLVLEVVRDARRLLALRVEGDQLGGELPHGLAGAGPQVLPGLAAELRQRRRACVGADVLRDLAELLVRDIEAVVAPEREEEVVARDARDLLRLETEQLPDAVVLVDDEVACPEVREGGERPAEAAVGARRPLAEDLCVGQEDEAELAPDESAARGGDGEEKLRLLGKLLARLENPRIGPLEQVLRAQRLTRMRKRDDDSVAAADEARELRLGLGEPARGDRRPLGLERERLPLRERVELGAAFERDLFEAFLGPDAPDLVGLPARSRARGRAPARGRAGPPA